MWASPRLPAIRRTSLSISRATEVKPAHPDQVREALYQVSGNSAALAVPILP
ncbi:MAG: hypothetical protein F6K47_11160 [Symploca sp. SIO2E6]|nr:hypothetical protein [Symploca sp. SIO2E6]